MSAPSEITSIRLPRGLKAEVVALAGPGVDFSTIVRSLLVNFRNNELKKLQHAAAKADVSNPKEQNHG